MKFIEIEYKYKIDANKRLAFKDLVKDIEGISFVYIESYDIYYTRSDGEFLRYRYSEDKKQKRAEITYKKKSIESNNVIREEVNLRVDANDFETVDKFITGLDYKYNVKVFKACDIYETNEVQIVFYSVQDEENNWQSFVEIEVREGTFSTEEEGVEIMRKYEKLLEPLGITYQNRLSKSLYEMYKK